MNREDLIEEMRDCIGKQDPIVFFAKMVDAINLLFDQMEDLKEDLRQAKIQSALAIHWEPKLASNMLTEMIEELRKDKETFHDEISKLKGAWFSDEVTQNYQDFCKFWQDTLGWHPFLDYDK